MNFLTDPIGTKYGCSYSYLPGRLGTFGPLSEKPNDGRMVKDPIQLTGAQFKLVNCETPYMWEYSSIITMRTSYTFPTIATVLGNGTEETTIDMINLNKLQSVKKFESLGAFTVTGIPNYQLHVTKNLIGTEEYINGIAKFTISSTNLNCYVAFTMDNKRWVTWDTETTSWVDVDITQDTDTLREKMATYTTISNLTQADFAKYFINMRALGIALLVGTDSDNTDASYNISALNLDFVGDNTDSSTPTLQYFNFIKVGYEHNGNVKLIADRVIQTGIAYSTLINSSYGGLNTSLSVKTADRYNYLRFPQSDRKDGNDGEWDHCIVNADPAVLDGKTVDDVFNISIASITSNVSSSDMQSVIIRGGKSSANRYDTIKYNSTDVNTGFRPVLIIDNSSNKGLRTFPGPSLPVVTSLAEVTKGKCIGCDFVYNKSTNRIEFKNFGRPSAALFADWGTLPYTGSFYFNCVGYTNGGDRIFVADRNVKNDSVSLQSIINMANDPEVVSTTGSKISIDTSFAYLRIVSTESALEREELGGEYDTIFTNELDPSKTVAEIWHNDKSSIITATRSATTFNDVIVKGINDGKRQRFVADTEYIHDGQDTNGGGGFRPILIVPNQVSINYIEVTPYVVYEPHTAASKLKCEISVSDDSGAPIEYKLIINDDLATDLTEYSAEVNRDVDITDLLAGTKTNIGVCILNESGEDEVIYDFDVFKDAEYRLTTSRTFGKIYGGWNADSVNYKDTKAYAADSTIKQATVVGNAAYYTPSGYTNSIRFSK